MIWVCYVHAHLTLELSQEIVHTRASANSSHACWVLLFAGGIRIFAAVTALPCVYGSMVYDGMVRCFVTVVSNVYVHIVCTLQYSRMNKK